MPRNSKKLENKVPGHLSAESKKLWRTLVRDYQIEDEGLMLLRTALEAFDRLQEARKLVTKEGIVIADVRGGTRAHPALAVEKESRIALLRAWRQLGFESEPPRR